MKKMIPGFVLVWFAAMALMNCESSEPKLSINALEAGTVQVLYEGMVDNEGVKAALFTLYNDSTDTVLYFAYDAEHPHYSTEKQTDSGWVYLFWNFCGTGAEYLTLAPQAEVEFEVFPPYESCTWRLLLNLTDEDMGAAVMLRSEALEYTQP